MSEHAVDVPTEAGGAEEYVADPDADGIEPCQDVNARWRMAAGVLGGLAIGVCVTTLLLGRPRAGNRSDS